MFNDRDQQIITHFLSPNPDEPGSARAAWQDSRDTSSVWAMATPDTTSNDPRFVAPGAIPWLRLQVVGDQDGPTGGDALTVTKYIQRVNTRGGIVPATGCAVATDVGKKAFVPYTADYFFYRHVGRDDDGDRSTTVSITRTDSSNFPQSAQRRPLVWRSSLRAAASSVTKTASKPDVRTFASIRSDMGFSSARPGGAATMTPRTANARPLETTTITARRMSAAVSKGGSEGSLIQRSVTCTPFEPDRPDDPPLNRSAVAASLQPEFGPSSRPCCRRPTVHAFRAGTARKHGGNDRNHAAT